MRQSIQLERILDNAVHVVGLAFATAACIAMAVLAIGRSDGLHAASLAVYGAGLAAMLGTSALYHLAWRHRWTEAFGRLDRAAIFLMIAATYTPFTLVSLGGRLGDAFCAFVWIVAASGAVLQLAAPHRLQRLRLAAYLLLGWSASVIMGPLLRVISLPGLVLLGSGGALYTIGVPFYLSKIPCRKAIWHGFVLAAAACHFSAVITDIVF